MTINETPIYKRFYSIINKWLTMRDSDKSWFIQDSKHRWLSRYVVEMLAELNTYIHSSFDEIKRIEIQASGHVDYMTKLSLYCTELYYKNLNIKRK